MAICTDTLVMIPYHIHALIPHVSLKVHPQPETYWGHVNPIGPRACYDEGKRVSETMMYAYAKQVVAMVICCHGNSA